MNIHTASTIAKEAAFREGAPAIQSYDSGYEHSVERWVKAQDLLREEDVRAGRRQALERVRSSDADRRVPHREPTLGGQSLADFARELGELFHHYRERLAPDFRPSGSDRPCEWGQLPQGERDLMTATALQVLLHLAKVEYGQVPGV
jgi:hypothetical protein